MVVPKFMENFSSPLRKLILTIRSGALKCSIKTTLYCHTIKVHLIEVHFMIYSITFAFPKAGTFNLTVCPISTSIQSPYSRPIFLCFSFLLIPSIKYLSSYPEILSFEGSVGTSAQYGL